MSQSPEPFVQALAARDFAGIAALLARDVKLRALIPPGFREASGAEDCAALLERWFGDADPIEVLSTSGDQVAGKRSIAYRLRLRENGVWYVVAQHIFCTLEAGKIVQMDLLCSGFQPE